MGRPKKDAKYLNVYIRKDIYDDFDKVCKNLGQSKTVAAERALSQYIRDISMIRMPEKNEVHANND